MWSEDAQKKLSDDEEEEDSEEESEDESDDAGPSTQTLSAAELSREERRKEKKARKEAALAKARKHVEVGDLPPSDSEEESEDEMPANPNHSAKARNQTKVSPVVDEDAEGVEKLSLAPSRREREAMEAQAAKERYRKLHEAGKTDEAKADLARLAVIRQKREEEAARKKVRSPQLCHHVKPKIINVLSRPRRRRRKPKTRPSGPRSRLGKPRGERRLLGHRRRGRRNEGYKCPRILYQRHSQAFYLTWLF
jgi:hypothetical protein